VKLRKFVKKRKGNNKKLKKIVAIVISDLFAQVEYEITQKIKQSEKENLLKLSGDEETSIITNPVTSQEAKSKKKEEKRNLKAVENKNKLRKK